MTGKKITLGDRAWLCSISNTCTVVSQGGCRVMQGLVDSLPSFRHEQLQHENFEGHRGTITVVVVKKLLPRRSCCFAHDPCSNES
ncbi:TPA: hypothetical protein ACH3X2_009506 [Trebouxia sp. C0005]